MENKNKYVIDCKVYSKSWFRVWSDGWLEQGGLFNVSQMIEGGSFSNAELCTLPKPFRDSDYHLRAVVVTYERYKQSGDDVDVTLGEKTRSSFKAMIWDDGDGTWTNNGVSWYACGFMKGFNYE